MTCSIPKGIRGGSAVGRMLRASLSLGFVLFFVARAALADPPMTQLTNDPESERFPAWSPDGAWIVFASDRGGSWDLWLMPAAGGPAIQLTDDPAYDDRPAWSPDGTRIAFASTRAGNSDIWLMPATGGPATQLTSEIGRASCRERV